MSEYSERHTISRLIGAPPGYVGFEQAGLLTDAVLKNPHSVILLDEIEKAHSDIWNILLQIMDHGTLTDNNGRKADFRNTILIMTSNVGSREMERRPLGMGTPGREEFERAESGRADVFSGIQKPPRFDRLFQSAGSGDGRTGCRQTTPGTRSAASWRRKWNSTSLLKSAIGWRKRVTIASWARGRSRG